MTIGAPRTEREYLRDRATSLRSWAANQRDLANKCIANAEMFERQAAEIESRVGECQPKNPEGWMATAISLKPGWLKNDIRRAAIKAARERLAEAEAARTKCIRELATADYAVKEAAIELRLAKRRT